MSKQDLIDAIASETGLTKVDSKKALEGIISAITGSLKKGENIALVGFGTYKVTERAARTGRNPQTGKALEIKAKKVVSFKAGKELSTAVQ